MTHDYEDLIGKLFRLQLARPALYVLVQAGGPVRQSDLALKLVAATGRSVHSRTLGNAIRFLTDAGLVTRQQRDSRRVVYEATRLGHRFIMILDAAEQAARERLRDVRRVPDPNPD